MFVLRGEFSLMKLPEVNGILVIDCITVVDGDTCGDTDELLIGLIGGDNWMFCWPWKTFLLGVDDGVIVGDFVLVWSLDEIVVESFLVSDIISSSSQVKI